MLFLQDFKMLHMLTRPIIDFPAMGQSGSRKAIMVDKYLIAIGKGIPEK